MLIKIWRVRLISIPEFGITVIAIGLLALGGFVLLIRMDLFPLKKTFSIYPLFFDIRCEPRSQSGSIHFSILGFPKRAIL